MELVNHRISLDIHRQTTQAYLAVKKGDTARQIVASLVSGRTPYSIAEGCFAVFMAQKPDGSILYNDCTIEGDQIIYTFTEQTASAPGLTACELRLYGSDRNLITSPGFAIIVSDTIYSDSEVESTDEFSALSKLVADVQAFQADFPNALPNPQALTINGQVYDGSTPIGVETGFFLVVVSSDGVGGYKADKTLDEIDAAYAAGRPLCCQYGTLLPLMSTYISGTRTSYCFEGFYYFNCLYQVKIDEDGVSVSVKTLAYMSDIPRNLPNPYGLTINGTTYDGSEAVNIEISGGSGEAPYIGSNGNWWIGEDDTGVKASGEDGRSVYSVELDASQSDESKSVYSMTDDGDRTIGSFTVYHGKDGGQGPQGPQGDSYVLTDADKAEIAEQVECATIVQPPKYVETVEEMTDTDRPYVLASTGRIYAYMDETYEQEVTVTDQIEATDDNPYLDGNRLGGSGDSFSADAAGYHVTPLIDLTKAEYVGKTIQLHLEGAHYCSTGSLETWIQCRLYGTDKAVLATRPYTCDAAVDDAYVEYITDGIEISYNSETSATITITVLPTYSSASVKIGYIRFCGKGSVADSNIYITYQDTQTVTGGHWVDTGTTYAPALTDEEKQEIVDQVIERIDTELLSVIGSGEVV